MLEIRNLKKSFDSGTEALRGVDLKVNKGSRTFLKKWGFLPTFFVKHYLRGGKFIKNRILSSHYSGPLKEPVKNFSYYFDLFISKIKLFKLSLFKS